MSSSISSPESPSSSLQESSLPVISSYAVPLNPDSSTFSLTPYEKSMRNQKIKTVANLIFLGFLTLAGIAFLISYTGAYSIPNITQWVGNNLVILSCLTAITGLASIGGIIYYKQHFPSKLVA